MKTYIFLMLIASFNLRAETVPLPPAVSTVNDIVNEFRNSLAMKITELGKNFITNTANQSIIFKNSAATKCNENLIPAGEALASIRYNFNKQTNELIEKVTYTGCKDEITLIEDVVTRGGKLAPLKFSDLTKGKREFELDDEETYRLYRVSNAENEEIFKMLIEKKDKSKLVELYIAGQKFLRMNYDFQEKLTKLSFTYYGYQAKYVRHYGTWTISSNFEPFTNTVMAGMNQITYLDKAGFAIPQNGYSTTFDTYVNSRTLTTIRSIFDYHNFYFPSTQLMQDGAANARLKEELRIASNRLQNNTELNLVKKQIQEYMEAVENGLIIDKRPKQ
jgi:hypothetical protein